MTAARLAYRVHSWTGLLTGWLLFVLCLTGTLVVYKYPLKALSNPDMASFSQQADIGPDQALAGFRQAYPAHQVSVVAFLSDAYSIGQYSIVAEKPEGGRGRFWIHPATGEIRPELQSDFADFVQRLHATLYFGTKPGRAIVGVLGVLMVLSILSGLIFHWRRLDKDLFKLRLSAPMRKAWSDLHKMIGVWTLPFALVIAVTGAWLGLETLIKIPSGSTAPLELKGEGQAVSLPIAELVARAQAQRPDFTPTHINFARLDHAGSTARVQGDQPGSRLVQRGQTMLVFEADTGRHLQTIDRTQQGLGRYVLASMRPLHYGYFWGGLSEFLYVVLGALSTAGVASGLIIWAERDKRKRGGKQAKATGMERANLAVMGGSLVSLAAFSLVFFASHLIGYPLSFAGSHDLVSGKILAPELPAYLATWAAAGVVLSRLDPLKGWGLCLKLTSGLCLILPLLAVMAQSQPLKAALHPFGLGFLLLTWALAGSFWLLSRRLSSSHPDLRS